MLRFVIFFDAQNAAASWPFPPPEPQGDTTATLEEAEDTFWVILPEEDEPVVRLPTLGMQDLDGRWGRGYGSPKFWL